MLFLQGATLPIGTCVPAGVPGYKIVTEQAKIATCPMVVRLEGDEDFILLAFKNNGANFYLYGLSAQALLAWKAPEKGDESEESILHLINLNHPKLIGAVELENTETCALKDKVEELLARLPSFSRQAVSSRPSVTGATSSAAGACAKCPAPAWARGPTSLLVVVEDTRGSRGGG